MSDEIARKIVDSAETVTGSLASLAASWSENKSGVVLHLDVIKKANVVFGIGEKEKTYPIDPATGERMPDDGE